MTILIVVLGLTVLLLAIWLLKTFSSKINFFATGLDSKFTVSEISILWKLAKVVSLEEPESLFFSVNAISKCISNLIETTRSNGTDNLPETQNFLTKLYKFRTKLELLSDKKRGLDSSRVLDNGQKLRLILKGSGIFSSRILNNGRELIITIPIQNGKIKIPGPDWVGKEVSVYLWRKGDAGYVFDTSVLYSGIFLGQNVLYLAHSENLFRAQKRKSIRTECHVIAQLYIIRETVTDFSQVETAPGYKCIIEDISSDGALIRAGGKGVNNIQIKLQFQLEDTLILMYGIVRSVEYNATNNQSRLHIECMHIEPAMRNAILSFVYKIMPEEQRNAEEALTQLEDEQKAENGGASDGKEQSDVTKNKENSFTIEIPNAIDSGALYNTSDITSSAQGENR